jgi:hypothetical protein
MSVEASWNSFVCWASESSSAFWSCSASFSRHAVSIRLTSPSTMASKALEAAE